MRTPIAIAIATAADFRELIPEDRPLLDLLAERGILARPVVWSEPHDWSQYRAVLIRSVWDYYRQLPRFVAWLDELGAQGVPLFNSQALVRWNLDKRYLGELRDRGVPIVPTHFIAPQTATATAMAELWALPWPELVLKPAVSAGAYRTLRTPLAELPRHQAQVAELLTEAALLAQPLLPEVISDGELSLIFFAGVYSHAVRKRAATGDFRVQEKHGGSLAVYLAPPPLVAQAQALLKALPELPLYARVDGVVRDGQLLLM
jgi:glutathione synthase/RimK-type ligase-like ATP-grasp enzyme